ncbi:MAG: hypothetical protein F4Y06_00430 [Rhodospirillales bacterium]|nr:hypothetical protein [Rhodospirillales bacterium]
MGEHAGAHGATQILEVGDVYDMGALSSRSLNQPMERVRGFPGIRWPLMPGHHGPQRSTGLRANGQALNYDPL